MRDRADESTAGQPDDPADELATLRGRCISGATGGPLAGMRVEFRGFPRTEGLAWTHGETPWDAAAPIVTGADGGFEFRFRVYPWFRHALVISDEGLAVRDGYFPAFAPRQTLDLGDLAFERGFPVSGFVRDADRRPVADVAVLVRGSYPDGRLDPRPNSGSFVREGRSGADGGFVIAGFLPAGTWRLDVVGGPEGDPCDEFERRSPESIEVLPGVGATDVAVTVRRRSSIEGTITDENGAPVRELRLSVLRGDERLGFGQARDGRFRVFPFEGEPEPVQIGLWDTDGNSHYEPFRTTTSFVWGARGVRLSVRTRGSLELEVVEAGTGTPVEEFAVKRSMPAGETGRHGTLVYHGLSPGGRRKLHRVPTGELVVQVVPRRPDLVASRPLLVAVSEPRPAPLRIELERATRFTVRVLHPDRSPVSGATVELIDCQARGRVLDDWTVEDERRSFGTEGSISTLDHDATLSLISKGATDAEGRARVFGSRLVPRQALRVLSPGHRPAIAEEFVLPAEDGEVEVSLSRGAGIDVTVKPVAVAAMRGAGFALRRSHDALTLPRLGGQPFDQAGTARARGIPPGAWEVLFVHSDCRLDPPLARVELKEGEIHGLELDLPGLAPARLEGKVAWKGGPWQSGNVTLDARIQGRHVRASAAVDTSGRFVAEDLFPGRYQVSVSLRVLAGQMQFADAELVELAPGMNLTRAFELVPRRLRLQLLDDAGQPAGSKGGWLMGEAIHAPFLTDARGVALVTPVPGAEVRVRIGRDELPGRYAIPPDPEPELVIRWPAQER